MSLNVSVKVGGQGLLEQARAVAAANRAAQVERERQQRIAAEAAQKVDQGRGDVDGNGQAVNHRQDKRPAAQRITSGLAHCWIRIPWSTPYFPATSVQVGCGDGTAWLDVPVDASEVEVIPFGSLPDGTGGYTTDGHVNPAVIHMPSGGENSIIVLAQQAIRASALSLGGTPPTSIDFFVGQSRDYLAFTVGRSRIRQITVPSALAAIIDAMMPAYDTIVTGEFSNVILVKNFPSETGGSGPNNTSARLFRDGNNEFRQVHFGMHDWARISGPASPAVFQVLDDPLAAVNAFVAAGSSYALSRPFFTPAPPQKRIVQYARPGESPANNFNVYYGPPTYPYSDLQYLLNAGNDPAELTTDVTTGVPVKPYTLSPDKVPKPGFTAGTVRVAWDWGQPGYCRSQLAALGFTPGDLVP